MKKETKTVITLDKKSLQNVLEKALDLPKKFKFEIEAEVVDDKSNPGYHDFRDGWPQKGEFKNITITY